MPEYTITAVSPDVRDWSSQQGGPMKAYRIHLNGPDGALTNVEWSRKANSPAPTVGEKHDFTIEDRGQYGLRAKKTPGAGGGPGGGGRPRDPGERRSIQMQHAQKCAVSILEVAAAHGNYKPPAAVDVATQVKAVARVLFDQIEEVIG